MLELVGDSDGLAAQEAAGDKPVRAVTLDVGGKEPSKDHLPTMLLALNGICSGEIRGRPGTDTVKWSATR